ncbi:heavy metal sensor histidine kinase [Luteimonas panaciterrae]|uniref:heavy metal sensor histidine kinase n=1 Tax=Luteimonas panaciterrae TaxID=363885 RepID=UPI001CFBD45A|nr:heavy metal sensor histidine kinase [Luteimonas panaciterrae]
MKLPSLVVRIMRAQTLATALMFLATGTAIFAFQKSELNRQQTKELFTRLQIILPMVDRTHQSHKWALLKERLESFTPRGDSLRFIIDSGDPQFNFGTPFPADAPVRRVADGSFYVQLGDRTFHAVQTDVPAREERPALRLTVALDHRSVEQTSLMLGLGIGGISLLAVVIVGVLSRTIARRGLRPLDKLSHHAAGLNPNDPEALLPLDDLPEELREMTRAFNGALERLHVANARLSSFNADVAHELRTPLGNMIGQTQVVLSRPRTGDELQEVLHSNLEELERMRSIVNDMLFLARADQGAMVDNLVVTSIAEIARRAAELFESILDETGRTLEVDGDAVAAVEPSLLGRAIANLIDNAIRHGDSNGSIRVLIHQDDEVATVSVRNPANAAIASQIDRWFDRFFRLDSARRHDGGSHGLGLAIAKAVVTMHGGKVSARYQEGEIAIDLSLPAVSDTAACDSETKPIAASRAFAVAASGLTTKPTVEG